jgi:hypothetical protein
MTTSVLNVTYTDSAGNSVNLFLNVGPVSGDSGNPILAVSGTYNGNSIQYPVPANNPLLPSGLTNEFYATPANMPTGLRSGFAFLVNSNANTTGVAVLAGYNVINPTVHGWVSDNFFPNGAGNSSGAAYITVKQVPGTVYLVKSAIYGAGATNAYQCTASSVASALQQYLDQGITQLVICNGEPTPNPGNTSPYPPFSDPAIGDAKVFAACVSVNGTDQYYACAEGQTIDFSIAPITNLN